MRITITLFGLLLGLAALGQQKPLTPAELPKKPPYERLLKGKDAKTAAEMRQSYEKYRQAGDFAEAKRYAQALIDFRTLKQGADHHEVIAAKQWLKNVEIHAKLTPQERKELAEANIMAQVMDMLYQQGQFRRAAQLGERVPATPKKLLGEQHPHYAHSLSSLALLYDSMGTYAQAEPLLRDCTRSYEMSRTARGTGFQRALGGDGENPYPSLAAVSARLGKPQAAAEALERNLARAFLDVQAERRGQQMTPDQQTRGTQIVTALSPIEKRISQLVDRVKRTEAEAKELAEKIAARNQLTVQLAELAAEVSRQEVSDLAGIQKAIPSGAALLTWVDVLGGDGKGQTQDHWACVLRSSGEPFWVPLPGTGEKGQWTDKDSQLPNLVRAALSANRPPINWADLVQQLRKQRIEPVLAHLKEHNITQLLLVGVEEMAAIPVEVLAPEFAISYVPSGTFLARQPQKPKFDNTLLAIGDPIYEVDKKRATSTTQQVAARDGFFADLPGTRYEVVRIAELFPSAKVLLDGNANERAVDELRRSDQLKSFRYLHFATHGKGNEVTAFESKLILSQDRKKEDVRKDGQPFFNNEISAREVLDHWKLNADLVTLSACQTGLGKQGSGDGLLGFAQAFLLTGARSVCLSLWEVDDTATALLMQRFYQNLLDKRPGLTAPMPKYPALQEAKDWLKNLTNQQVTEQTAALMNGISRASRDRGEVAVKKEDREKADTPSNKPYNHPRFWSAFILLGERE